MAGIKTTLQSTQTDRPSISVNRIGEHVRISRSQPQLIAMDFTLLEALGIERELREILLREPSETPEPFGGPVGGGTANAS